MSARTISTLLILFLCLALASTGCQQVPAEAARITDGASPAEVTEAFYDWYLDYIGDPASEDFRNPMADRAYRGSPYLADSFEAHVDELLDGFAGAGYDPFLCAQAIPNAITVDGVHVSGEAASALVRTDFPGHALTVDLRQEDGVWQIGNIVCTMTPEGTAQAFYTWYLAYIGDRSTGEFNNPLVDRAYRESGFLTQGFIERLDAAVDEGLHFDPILLAQDVPQSFTVDPGVEPGTAIVHAQFGPDSVRHLLITLQEEMGYWRIDQVDEAR